MNWMDEFGGTRNQVRRIIHNASHDEVLDDAWTVYRERFFKVEAADWGFSLLSLMER